MSASTAALAAALVTSLAGAATLPNLRSATVRRGHVVVRYTLGELAPGRVLVAKRRTTMDGGKFVTANVLVNEPLRSVKTSTGYRARTRHTLPAGRYYVEVSGTVILQDCTPRKPCPSRWSNVRRVRVP